MEDDYKQRFGERVKLARRAAGLTQADAAAEASKAGLSLTQVMIAKIESGNRPTTVYELITLASIFDVPPSRLLPGAVDESAVLARKSALLMSKTHDLVNLNIVEEVATQVAELKANLEGNLDYLERGLKALGDDQ